MVKRISIILAFLLSLAAPSAWLTAEGVDRTDSVLASFRPAHVGSVAFATSQELRRFAQRAKSGTADGGLVIRPELPPTRVISSGAKADTDGALANVSGKGMPGPVLSFNALSNFDNLDAYELLFLPPDANGDVGPNHYVQAVNALLRVFDKAGNPLTQPLKFSDIFAPLRTPCSVRNDGSPVVLYDSLADRWLISQYCNNFPPFRQLIAVSRTGDPASDYYLYEFVMPNIRLNDYSKFGVWPDGYYMSTDEFVGSDYYGSGLFAFDREKMLAGSGSAGYIYFSVPGSSPARTGGFLPADLDGLNAPPRGAPAIFAGYSATEYGDAQDGIRLFEFRADFREPERSTLSERPESPLATAPFDPTSPPNRADIAQPPPGEFLDSVSDRVMYRVAYRNYGSHESIVFNQTVRVSPADGAYRAGVRLYELRRDQNGFRLHEQMTIGDGGSSRWIGSAAQDGDGNTAVGYSFVTDDKEPAIKYTGRLASDPAGSVRPESSLIDGTGVQKAFGWRWGGYSGMTVDPDDDCTFWLTNQYFTRESQEFSDFTWLTRVGSFKFDECTPAARGKVQVTVLNSTDNSGIAASLIKLFPGLDIGAVPFTRQTLSTGQSESILIPPGSYSVTAEAHGFRSAAANVQVSADRQTPAKVTLLLDPVPVIDVQSMAMVQESCSLNRVPEPGETVTVDISMMNSGRRATQHLSAAVLPTGGVLDPGPPQDFGSVSANGGIATRPFIFRISPDLPCGSPANLTLELRDGEVNYGIITAQLQTGETRYALRESFDAAQNPRLPETWLTSAEDGQQIWRLRNVKGPAEPMSAYSPAPNRVGVNELVSPEFQVSSAGAVLGFYNRYDLETTFLRNRLYDGAVLDIRIDDGDWQDIVAAGGLFESGGYDGILDSCCQNPLGGRWGWSGRSGINQSPEFIVTKIRLPAAAAGRNIRLRWRVATDIGGSRQGQFIDDIEVTDGYSCSCGNIR